MSRENQLRKDMEKALAYVRLLKTTLGGTFRENVRTYRKIEQAEEDIRGIIAKLRNLMNLTEALTKLSEANTGGPEI